MFKSLFILLSIVSAAAAFAPVATPNSIKLQLHESTLDEQFPTTIEDSSDTLALSRRNAMFKGSALLLSAIAVSTSPNAAYADIYDDQEKERKLKAKEVPSSSPPSPSPHPQMQPMRIST